MIVDCPAAANLTASNMFAIGTGPWTSNNVGTWTVVECVYGYAWNDTLANAPTNYSCTPDSTSSTTTASTWQTTNRTTCICVFKLAENRLVQELN